MMLLKPERPVPVNDGVRSSLLPNQSKSYTVSKPLVTIQIMQLDRIAHADGDLCTNRSRNNERASIFRGYSLEECVYVRPDPKAFPLP